jgi:hypothetical protein
MAIKGSKYKNIDFNNKNRNSPDFVYLSFGKLILTKRSHDSFLQIVQDYLLPASRYHKTTHQGIHCLFHNNKAKSTKYTKKNCLSTQLMCRSSWRFALWKLQGIQSRPSHTPASNFLNSLHVNAAMLTLTNLSSSPNPSPPARTPMEDLLKGPPYL